MGGPLPDDSVSPLARAAVNLAFETWHALRNLGVRGRLSRSVTRRGPPVRVNLGCGADVRPGWLNLDLQPPRQARTHARTSGAELVRCDLRRGLPLPPASCSLIYSSHVFEHLEFRHGLRLMRDSLRALAPGGRFRIALPDFRRVFDAYLRSDDDYFALLDPSAAFPYNESGMEARVDLVNYCVYQNGEHRFIYDEEKLLRTLRSVGFRSASIVDYDPAVDPPTPPRRRYSFYAEAFR